jgi:hypothetical protein
MNHIVKVNGNFVVLDEKEVERLSEGLMGMFGTIIASMAVRDMVMKGDDLFFQSGLRSGDKVVRSVVDVFRKRFEYEGVISFKGKIPYVIIKKGKDSVGQGVKWTPDWVKK